MVDGRTLYSDRACTAGQQSTYAIDPQPLPADRIAADARLRDDKRALAAMERERLKQEATRPAASRGDAERARQARLCARLTLRAKRAREDEERAGPRDQQKQIRTRRAEEDRAVACPRR